MTKVQELESIAADQAMLTRDAEREKEVIEACVARLAVIVAKQQRLADRLKAVQESRWE